MLMELPIIIDLSRWITIFAILVTVIGMALIVGYRVLRHLGRMGNPIGATQTYQSLHLIHSTEIGEEVCEDAIKRGRTWDGVDEF